MGIDVGLMVIIVGVGDIVVSCMVNGVEDTAGVLESINCRVPQLMSVLLTEFLSALDMFSVFVKIDIVVIE